MECYVKQLAIKPRVICRRCYIHSRLRQVYVYRHFAGICFPHGIRYIYSYHMIAVSKYSWIQCNICYRVVHHCSIFNLYTVVIDRVIEWCCFVVPRMECYVKRLAIKPRIVRRRRYLHRRRCVINCYIIARCIYRVVVVSDIICCIYSYGVIAVCNGTYIKGCIPKVSSLIVHIEPVSAVRSIF